MSQVNLTIDGKETTAAPGTNLIEAAKALGIEVPHYCYHARLSVAGNCRMCLVAVGLPKKNPDGSLARDAEGKVAIGFLPKLQIACATTVAEGMVVKTHGEEVDKARQGVMEFLLINHPLDCPICDQAGECRLQEFAVDYGRGESRFVELKVHKPKQVSLGPKVVLDNERCILCSRCERFMREVAKQDCLGITKRGSHAELSCYPGKEPDTNYDLNIVDICPVGALTSRDFRFRMRPWFLKETRSVCPSCATGCNVTLWSRDREVYRLTPRDNDHVNQSWMCDYGRLNYRFINDAKRLTGASCRESGADRVAVTWEQALQQAAYLLSLGRNIAVIGSARSSTEELMLLARVARLLGARLLDCVPRTAKADGFLLHEDRNPNLWGAILTGVAADPPGSRLGELAHGLADGTIDTLLIAHEDLAALGVHPDTLARVPRLIVIDTLPNATALAAHVLMPGAVYAEKAGTFINAKGRLQRLDAAVPPPGDARADCDILGALYNRLTGQAWTGGSEQAFTELAAELPALKSAGIFHRAQIDLQGVDLGLGQAPVARPQLAPARPSTSAGTGVRP